jgi:hypothetical protein
MREVAAHDAARLLAVPHARLIIQIDDLLEPAETHGGRERRHDQIAAEPCGKLDGKLRERRDVSRDRLLHRLRRDAHVFEGIVLALVRDAVFRRPEFAHELKPFLEDSLIVVEGNVERQIFALVVTAPGGEIDAAVRKQIERRPLFRDADRMMQRQHGDRRRQPDMLRARGDIGKHEVGAGEHAQRIEMVLADPCGMHAERIGEQRFVRDVGNELVRRPRIVFVVIVAQREIAEFHGASP